MQGDHHRTLLLCDPCLQQIEHPVAVSKIQSTFRLIQQQQPAPGDQCPRQNAQLLLPFAQAKVVALLSSTQSHLLQRLCSQVLHFSSRTFQQTQARIKAHHHHIQHRYVDGDAASLGNISNQSCHPAGRQLLQHRLLQQAGSFMRQDSAYCLEQGGFSAAVRSQNPHHTALFQLKGDIRKNRMPAIAGRDFLNR